MGINLSNVASATDVAWDRIAEIFTTVRFTVYWSDIESSAGTQVWTSLDTAVDAATSRGLTVMLILCYGNVACGGTSIDPTDATENLSTYPPLSGTYWDYWEDFVTALVTRYADRRVFYEVWNEPHSPVFWQPKADPEAAGSFTARTCKVIRDAKKTAYIVTGGGLPLNSWYNSPITTSMSQK